MRSAFGRTDRAAKVHARTQASVGSGVGQLLLPPQKRRSPREAGRPNYRDVVVFLEREKGFEPSTSTLARLFRPPQSFNKPSHHQQLASSGVACRCLLTRPKWNLRWTFKCCVDTQEARCFGASTFGASLQRVERTRVLVLRRRPRSTLGPRLPRVEAKARAASRRVRRHREHAGTIDHPSRVRP